MSRYKVKKIITYWRSSAQSNEKVGWLLHDFETQRDYGYTFEEAWQLINEYGATNASAIIKKTKNWEIKDLVPASPQPSFLDTSWQIKIENTNDKDLTFSPTCLETIQKLVFIDEKNKITRNKEQWLRMHKDLTSSWKTYENIMNCIEIAQQIQKANNIAIYVGASIWEELGFSRVFAADLGVDPNHLEYLFFQSLETELSLMNINANQDLFNYVNLPYLFDFIKIVKSLKSNVKILFEVGEGVFQKKENETLIDLGLVIGAKAPVEMDNIEKIYYIGPQPCLDSNRYSIIVHAPISQALMEVERHFVMRGRILCDVCGEKVVHGVGCSTIAPVTVAVCPSCGSKGAQPYGILVSHVAYLMSRIPYYKLSPKLLFVKEATLSLTGISEGKFNKDVINKLNEIRDRKF